MQDWQKTIHVAKLEQECFLWQLVGLYNCVYPATGWGIWEIRGIWGRTWGNRGGILGEVCKDSSWATGRSSRGGWEWSGWRWSWNRTGYVTTYPLEIFMLLFSFSFIFLLLHNVVFFQLATKVMFGGFVLSFVAWELWKHIVTHLFPCEQTVNRGAWIGGPRRSSCSISQGTWQKLHHSTTTTPWRPCHQIWRKVPWLQILCLLFLRIYV